MGINIRHALIIGLALDRSTETLINEIYSKNEKEYYEIYINSDFYDDYLKRTFTLEVEDRINKLIGIVEKCYNDNNFILIEKIIRVINPSIVNFAKNSNEINLQLFNHKYLKDKIDILVEQDIFIIFVCLIYLGKLYNKNVVGRDQILYFSKYWDSYKKAVYLEGRKYDLIIGDNDYTEAVGTKYKYFGLEPFEEIKENTLSLFMENNIEREVYRDLEDYGYNGFDENIPMELFNKVRSKVFIRDGVNKLIGSYSRYVDTLGINNLDIFNDIKFNNDILNMILKEVCYANANNNLSEDEECNYISSSMFIYGLVELYKNAKDLYLNKSKEDKYKDLVKYERLIEEEKEKIYKDNNKLEKNIALKDDKIKKLQEEIKLLKYTNSNLNKENTILKNDISKLREDNKNLRSENKDIKNIIDNYDFANSYNIKDEIPLEDILRKINEFKVGIFGGMKNISDLSDKLENVSFYNSLNKDISSIKNLDIVFINSDFFKHAFTKKVFSVAEKYNVPVNYISGTNDIVILNRIYSVLMKI